MLQLTAAGKRFGPKLLFEGLDWLITPGECAGIVGGNGTGKSTLLKVLAGLEQLDYGSLTRAKGTSFGYLPQDGLQLSGRTVFEECLSVFSELRGMQHEMETLAASMATLDHDGTEYAAASTRYGQIEHELRTRDAYALEAQTGAVLNGLGFGKEDWTRRTEEFSGGWQMRISLAKLLLAKPNLLLLDEPTNHLDLESRNWLEGYLRTYPHAFVLISHDRYFLDVTVDRIVEIWNKQVHFYPGNYEKYLEQKQQRREQLESAYRNQREKIEQLEQFINRFRAQATKAKQVQSRIKELERIERVQLPVEEKTIHFTFPQPQPSGRTVVEAKMVAKHYGEKVVFRGASFVIERGERVALLGANGAGKSTLIRLLSAADAPTSGELRWGHNVETDYFAQDQYKALDPTRRMLDDIREAAPTKTNTELRSLLGCFLFSEDDVYKTIGVLSGGERNRYALARMLLRPSNFLLLDEPTNHLDLRAKDVLLEAMSKFTGTVVFVSHDRYFIDKLATRVFEIGGGEVHVFPGNYEDYIWRKQRDEGAATNGAGTRVAPPPPTLADVPGARAVQNGANGVNGGPRKRINPIKQRQINVRIRQIEDEIARAEAEVTAQEAALLNFTSAEETLERSRALEKARSQINALMQEWEELSGTALLKE